MSSKPVSEAQSKPTKRQCPSCGERVVITASDNWRCPECTTGFCHFCKTSVLDSRCPHLVASLTDDAGWNYSPFEHAPLPEVPDDLQGVEVQLEDWQQVFGEDADLIEEAYTDCRDLVATVEPEHERRLFEWMLYRRRIECESSSWEASTAWTTSSFGNDYFSAERDVVLAGIKEEVALLAVGLGRLFVIARERDKARQERIDAFQRQCAELGIPEAPDSFYQNASCTIEALATRSHRLRTARRQRDRPRRRSTGTKLRHPFRACAMDE